MRIAACLLLPLATAACAGSFAMSSGSDVDLTVDRGSYSAGDSITLTLSNETEADIGYNLCPAALEVLRAGAWATAGSLAEVCTMELRILAPSASGSMRHRLPTTLTAGEYRVRVNVERPLGGSRAVVTSGTFRVGGV